MKFDEISIEEKGVSLDWREATRTNLAATSLVPRERRNNPLAWVNIEASVDLKSGFDEISIEERSTSLDRAKGDFNPLEWQGTMDVKGGYRSAVEVGRT